MATLVKDFTETANFKMRLFAPLRILFFEVINPKKSIFTNNIYEHAFLTVLWYSNW